MFFENVFSLLAQGSQELIANYKLVLLMAAQVFGIGSLAYLCLKRQYSKLRPIMFESILTLGISLNVIIAFTGVWFSTFWAGALVFTAKGLFFFSLLGIVFFFLNGIEEYKTIKFSGSFFIFSFLVVLFFIVRFSFIAELEYPLYHDSAIHYQIITDFLHPNQTASAVYRIEGLIFNRYYHFGYHSFLIIFSTILQETVSITNLMLVSGQFLLVFFPISLGILSKELHGKSKAGWYVAVFAAFGWSFPFYAVNWGKYPALSASSLLPLGIYWFIKLKKNQGDVRFVSSISFFMSIISITLLHSRAILLLLCVFLVIYFSEKIPKHFFQENLPYILFANIQIISLVALFNSNFRDAAKHYFQNFNFIITLIAILLLFSILRHKLNIAIKMLTFVSLLAIFASFSVPVSLVKYAGKHLFDHPFIAIVLFEPLAIISGIGLFELINFFSIKIIKQHFFITISLILVVVSLLFFRPTADYLPNDCCNFMHDDDIFTIAWMGKALSQESTVFIAAQNEFPSNNPVDAGAWIFPLTGINTDKLDWDADFSKKEIYINLCSKEPAYIYASTVNSSFSITSLASNPSHYTLALGFPQTRLYQVNCDK